MAQDIVANSRRTLNAPAEVVLACLIGVAAVALYVFGTQMGIGIRPDSVVYLGYWEDGRQQAPLYTAIISFLTDVVGEATAAAWAFNLFLLLLNLALFCALIRYAGVSWFWSLAATAVLLFLPQFQYIHQTVLSEPLFMVTVTGTLLALSVHVRTGRRSALVLAAVLAAAALLTRFAGAPLVPTGGLAILLFGIGSLWRRLADGIIFGAVSAGVFLGWLMMDRAAGGDGVDRPFAFLGQPDFETYALAFDAFSSYLLPGFLPLALRAAAVAVAALIMVALIIAALRHVNLRAAPAGDAKVPAVAQVCALFVLFYLPFIFLTLYIEYGLTIHSRYALPVYVVTLALGVALPARPGVLSGRPLAQAVAVAAIAGLAFVNVGRGVEGTYALMTEGNFYTQPEWQQSPTVARAAAFDPEIKIYTDGPDAVRAIGRRKAVFWPRHYDSRTGLEHPAHPFAQEMAQIAEEVAAGEAVVVSFDNIAWRRYLATEQELVDQLSLDVIYEEADGRVFGKTGVTPVLD